jgi:hypothetical protein
MKEEEEADNRNEIESSLRAHTIDETKPQLRTGIHTNQNKAKLNKTKHRVRTVHLQFSEHNTLAWKHSQYFLRQCDFLQ